jgi:hypothetical protein
MEPASAVLHRRLAAWRAASPSSLHISALLMADRRDTARIPALLRAAGIIV